MKHKQSAYWRGDGVPIFVLPGTTNRAEKTAMLPVKELQTVMQGFLCSLYDSSLRRAHGANAMVKNVKGE